jgi:hypothetical protein
MAQDEFQPIGLGNTDLFAGFFDMEQSSVVPGGFALIDGSAAAPSLTFTADLDTGLFRAGTNALGFTVAGVERMRLTPTGLGIGNITPFTPLEVTGPGGNAILSLSSLLGGGVDTSLQFTYESNNHVFAKIEQVANTGVSWSSSLIFYTNDGASGANTTEEARVWINHDGYLGVGVNPGLPFHVETSFTSMMVRIRNTSTSVNAGGIDVGLAIATPIASNAYHRFLKAAYSALAGTITGDGAGGVLYNATSDERTKEDIQDMAPVLPDILQLRPVTYKGQDKGATKRMHGFLAQEVSAIRPELVTGQPDGDPLMNPMALDYGRLTPLLVKGIQELTARVETMMGQIETLEEQLNGR